MDNEAITKYIIAEFRKYRASDDIIEKVCEMSGMKWADAQEFVDRVQIEHKAEIKGLHNPYLVVLAIGMIVVGLGLIIAPFAAIFIWSAPLAAELIAYFFFMPGLTMTIGGVIGLLFMMEKR